MSDAPSSNTRSHDESAAAASKGQRTDMNKLEGAPMGGNAANLKEGQTVSTIVKMEHDGVKTLWQEYQTTGDSDVRLAKAHLIINQLVQHSCKEEAVLYPEMRKRMDNGDALVEHAKQEHQEVTEMLYKLDKMSYSAEFDTLITKIMTDLMHHIDDEETNMLPNLEAKCTMEELVALGKKFQSAIPTTRPHPMAPREGLGAAVASMASLPLDMAKDALRFDAKEKEDALA